MILYHAGFEEIKKPDIHFGRKNADFGQGFYLTDNEEFAHRWARARKDEQTVVNTYELAVEGLDICRLHRDAEWFNYIFDNRHGKDDTISADVIIGPIANDTIYDTLGVISSGFLSPEEAMRLLLIGPEYSQLVLKTEKAASLLTWLSSKTLTPDEVADYRKLVAAEEADYIRLFSEELDKL